MHGTKNVTYLKDKTEGEKMIAAFEFDTFESDELDIKIAILTVREAGAKKNLRKKSQ